MKNLTLLTAILLTVTMALGQGVAINETGAAPDLSAMLDVTSTSKGLLIPRMTIAQRNTIVLPKPGLLFFQTDATPGFYYNANTASSPNWQRLGDGSAGQWTLSGDNVYYNAGNVGIGTPSPSALLHTNGMGTGGGNVLFSGEFNAPHQGDPPATGAGTRMMWYPNKAAFRAGQVTGDHWNKDNVGNHSMALGYNVTAFGYYSVAMGSGSIALGPQSISIGANTTTSGQYSVALGSATTASGMYSTAMGLGTTASGTYSTAMGSFTTAKSFYETVIGVWNSDYTPDILGGWNTNDRLFVIGNGTSSDNRSNAMTVLKSGNTGLGIDTPTALLHTKGTGTGEGNVVFEGSYKDSNPGEPPASGEGTRMMWYPDKAAFRVGRVTGPHWDNDSIGKYSVALGYNTKAKGSWSTAIGETTKAMGMNSTAMGYSTTASGMASTAMGIHTNALGNRSLATGSSTTASGLVSAAMGNNTIAPSFAETVIGSFNLAYTPNSTTEWDSADRLFVIGNGTTSSNRSNAITVLKNGNIGLGIEVPTQKLDIDGQIRLRGGAPGNGKVLTSDANGVGSWQTPSYSNWTVSGSNIYRASGNVGIGSSAPGELLHVRNTSGTARIRVQSTNVSAIDFYNSTAYVAGIGISVSDGHLFLYNGGNVSVKGGNLGIGNTNPGQKLDITAGHGRVQSGYSWLTNSDARFKTNVSTLDNVLDKIGGFNGVRYDLKEDEEIIPGHGKHIGFIAQELESEFPEFVITGADGYKSVAYDKMTAVLLQAVKEQQAIIETMMKRIEMLEEER